MEITTEGINNRLKPWNNIYRFFSESVYIKERKKFIGSIYDNETLVLRFEYFIIGSYNKNKNIWLWASLSLTLDKPLVEEVLRFKSNIKNENKILDTEYGVYTTNEIVSFISELAKTNQIITIPFDDRIDVFNIKRILFENIN